MKSTQRLKIYTNFIQTLIIQKFLDRTVHSYRIEKYRRQHEYMQSTWLKTNAKQ